MFIVIISIEKENSEDIANGIMIIGNLRLHVSEKETNSCT